MAVSGPVGKKFALPRPPVAFLGEPMNSGLLFCLVRVDCSVTFCSVALAPWFDAGVNAMPSFPFFLTTLKVCGLSFLF